MSPLTNCERLPTHPHSSVCVQARHLRHVWAASPGREKLQTECRLGPFEGILPMLLLGWSRAPVHVQLCESTSETSETSEDARIGAFDSRQSSERASCLDWKEGNPSSETWNGPESLSLSLSKPVLNAGTGSALRRGSGRHATGHVDCAHVITKNLDPESHTPPRHVPSSDR